MTGSAADQQQPQAHYQTFGWTSTQTVATIGASFPQALPQPRDMALLWQLDTAASQIPSQILTCPPAPVL